MDGRDRVDVDAMKTSIREDRLRGHRPFCIVGNAGTVATGATDDLPRLAEVARAGNLWFHIDGAFGTLAKLSPRYRNVVDGLEHADSIAFVLYKWGYMQYEPGAVLVRSRKAHTDAFSFAPSYLETFRGRYRCRIDRISLPWYTTLARIPGPACLDESFNLWDRSHCSGYRKEH